MNHVHIGDVRIEAFQSLDVVFWKLIPLEPNTGGDNSRHGLARTDFIGNVKHIRYDRNGYVTRTSTRRAIFDLGLFQGDQDFLAWIDFVNIPYVGVEALQNGNKSRKVTFCNGSLPTQ